MADFKKLNADQLHYKLSEVNSLKKNIERTKNDLEKSKNDQKQLTSKRDREHAIISIKNKEKCSILERMNVQNQDRIELMNALEAKNEEFEIYQQLNLENSSEARVMST